MAGQVSIFLYPTLYYRPLQVKDLIVLEMVIQSQYLKEIKDFTLYYASTCTFLGVLPDSSSATRNSTGIDTPFPGAGRLCCPWLCSTTW